MTFDLEGAPDGAALVPPAEEASPSAATEPKPSRADIAKLIRELADEGLTAKEIGQRLGLSRQWVFKIAAQHHIRIPNVGPSRRIAVNLPVAIRKTIEAKAKEQGVSINTALRRVAVAVFMDNARLLERTIGKQAAPKRRYGRQGG